MSPHFLPEMPGLLHGSGGLAEPMELLAGPGCWCQRPARVSPWAGLGMSTQVPSASPQVLQHEHLWSCRDLDQGDIDSSFTC